MEWIHVKGACGPALPEDITTCSTALTWGDAKGWGVWWIGLYPAEKPDAVPTLALWTLPYLEEKKKPLQMRSNHTGLKQTLPPITDSRWGLRPSEAQQISRPYGIAGWLENILKSHQKVEGVWADLPGSWATHFVGLWYSSYWRISGTERGQNICSQSQN